MLLKVPFVSFKWKVPSPTSMLNIVRKGGVAYSNPPLIYNQIFAVEPERF